MTEYIVDKMKDEIRQQTGADKPVTVIGTGGMAYIVKDNSDCIDVIDKMLTLEGLLLIYEKNKADRVAGAEKSGKVVQSDKFNKVYQSEI